MKSFSDNEIREKFNNLPLPLKEAIYSADIAEVIVAISAKYGVTGKNVTNVSGEIGFIILGLTRPEEFAPRLAERLGIKPDDAKKLALDAYQAVLKPFATELKRVHGFDLNENAIDAKSPPVAQQAEPQKPPALVIPPRPIVQQTQPTPRPAPLPPTPPLRPIPPPPPQRAPAPRVPFAPPRTLEQTMQSPPPSRTPLKPPDIPRQAPAPPPPAPSPALPPEQVEPRPPATRRAPLAPPMPPQQNTPRESTIVPPPPPKLPTPPEPRAPRNIFSPQMPGPLESKREPARPTQEKPAEPPQPRVFTPLQPKPPSIPGGEEDGIPKVKESPKPFGRAVTGFTPKRPASPRDIDDPYRETVAPQEKELQQKRDAVSDPRGPQPPFQVRKGEPPYVNPKIPPIDLREDASRPPEPPAPPDPHWERIQ